LKIVILYPKVNVIKSNSVLETIHFFRRVDIPLIMFIIVSIEAEGDRGLHGAGGFH